MPLIEMCGELPEGLNAFDQYQVYNLLDVGITAQLLPIMRSKLGNMTSVIYEREMRLLSLCLEISTKGLPVSQMRMLELVARLDASTARSLRILARFCEAVGAPPLNPNSPKQVAEFFYDHLRVPTIWQWDAKTKTRKRGTDRDALEKLLETYPIAMPFVQCIFAARGSAKMASVFKRGLEPGNVTLRCSVSPSGTETGRLSSQQNPYGRGTNAQNLTDEVRQVIEAPAGYCILNVDLKTAESFAVGYISGDRAYISACAADLHTTVAAGTWTNLPWTGDRRRDREIADRPYYRHFSYRDMAKRGGHGSNYYGQPPQIARILKVPAKVIEEFQAGYFRSFPGIPEWHLDVIARIQCDGYIITPLARERRFWGRPDDKATWRAAIAFGPQSLIADVMNEGLMQVQDWIIRAAREVSLVMQVHDSGVFLVPIDGLADYAREIQARLMFPVDFGSLGTMRVPSDLTVGKRWSKSKLFPDGQRDYTPGQSLHFS